LSGFVVPKLPVPLKRPLVSNGSGWNCAQPSNNIRDPASTRHGMMLRATRGTARNALRPRHACASATLCVHPTARPETHKNRHPHPQHGIALVTYVDVAVLEVARVAAELGELPAREAPQELEHRCCSRGVVSVRYGSHQLPAQKRIISVCSRSAGRTVQNRPRATRAGPTQTGHGTEENKNRKKKNETKSI
jgi:hypothetical protein